MNPSVKILKTEILSDDWYVLRKHTIEHRSRTGTTRVYSREAYDRGNGATILLYNRSAATVLLTRQFRLPTFLNGNPTGLLIESCAGLLDAQEPIECVRREVQEETGYAIHDVTKILEVYMSPGSVTELLHFFVGEYSTDLKTHPGGGVAEEHEEIETFELRFSEALAMIGRGEIRDAKTILLLYHARLTGLL